MMDTTEVKYMKYLMKEFQKENEIINGQNELNVPKELSLKISNKVIKIEDDDKYKFPPSSNTTFYTLIEVILHIQNSNLTVNQFYARAIKRKNPIVICYLAT